MSDLPQHSGSMKQSDEEIQNVSHTFQYGVRASSLPIRRNTNRTRAGRSSFSHHQHTSAPELRENEIIVDKNKFLKLQEENDELKEENIQLKQLKEAVRVIIEECEDKQNYDFFVEQFNNAKELLEYDWKKNPPKKYTHPLMFIEDGKKYLDEGNEVQASEKAWAAFNLSVAFFYKELDTPINLVSHFATIKLARFAGKRHKEPHFFEIPITLLEDGHRNFYSGLSSTIKAKKYIKTAEIFIQKFSEIDKKKVYDDLQQFINEGCYKKLVFNKTELLYNAYLIID